MRYWLVVFWATLCFTPTLNLPIGQGNVPLRLDDVLAFGVFVWILLSRRRPVRHLHLVEKVLMLSIGIVFLLTLRGSPIAGLKVGSKEYLDVLRPFKFFCVFFLASRLPYTKFSQLPRLASAFTASLVAFALLQYSISSDSEGIIAKSSMLFGRMDESLFRHYLGYRSFATFSSPTDFGYYMSLTLVAAICITSLQHRVFIGALAALGLALAGTRTFIFGLPPILLGYFLFNGTIGQRLKRLTVGLVLIILLIGTYSTVLSTSAGEAGSTLRNLMLGTYDQDESLSERLQNLGLLTFTLNNAPLTGVISRDMFPNAIDSEYLMTFHRYGIVGLMSTLLLYGSCVVVTLRARAQHREIADFTLLTLTLSFAYGITQGALINTRVGCFMFLIMGALVARVRTERQLPVANSGAVPK